MPKRKFSKEFLRKDVLWGPKGVKVHDEIVETTRWSVVHWMVFAHEGKFYGVDYSRGATEQQDESPFEYSPDEVECTEMELVTKTVTVYEPVKG